MSAKHWILPSSAVALAVLALEPMRSARAYGLLGHSLGLGQRDFRVFDNFADPSANANTIAHASFPGATGAELAIWKAVVEWGSSLHGDGQGDPTQPAGLGSGGANFDATWQGLASGPGGLDDNTFSVIANCPSGTIAITEAPNAFGWRIRFCEAGITWDDGPNTSICGGCFDIQSSATQQYGHSLGLANSTVPGATMEVDTFPGSTSKRSLHFDDMAGIQAIYGVVDGQKPRIDEICVFGSTLRITGANFDSTNNTVWFTSSLADGEPVKVTDVASDGTTLTLPIPANAAPGDVLVHNQSLPDNRALSEAHPCDLVSGDPNCTSCQDPLNYCQTSPNSVGPGMTIGSSGQPSVSGQNFTLFAFTGPPNQPGIFFYGELQVNLPFGNGVRCVGAGPAGTFRLPVVQADAFGDANYTLDWGAPPIGSGPGELVPGDTWNFQYWYRDPAHGMSGFNLSDGLEVRVCD